MRKLLFLSTIFCIFSFVSSAQSEQKVSVVIQHEFLPWPQQTNNPPPQWQNIKEERSLTERLRMKAPDDGLIMLKTSSKPVLFKTSFDNNLNTPQKEENSRRFEERPENQAFIVARDIPLDENIREFEEYSKKQALMIDSTIQKYLRRKRIKVVEREGDLIIKIKTNLLNFDSLGGYFFQVVEYEAIEDGKIRFTGSFKQSDRSGGFSHYFVSPKNSHYIGIYLAKDILAKLNKLTVQEFYGTGCICSIIR